MVGVRVRMPVDAWCVRGGRVCRCLSRGLEADGRVGSHPAMCLPRASSFPSFFPFFPPVYLHTLRTPVIEPRSRKLVSPSDFRVAGARSRGMHVGVEWVWVPAFIVLAGPIISGG